jgi:hypothetical protein
LESILLGVRKDCTIGQLKIFFDKQGENYLTAGINKDVKM